jgi:fructose-1,6-bisphosphatase/inositol monophosphatase family enzyme
MSSFRRSSLSDLISHDIRAFRSAPFILAAIHAHVPAYIQDHAPGSLLVTEAGGAITDSRGEPLDFGLGRDLGENFGVIAAGKGVHIDVLAAVKEARQEEKEQKAKV